MLPKLLLTVLVAAPAFAADLQAVPAGATAESTPVPEPAPFLLGSLAMLLLLLPRRR